MPAPTMIAAFGPQRPAWLADLQGNTLKGHGRDHTLHLLLRFDKGDIALRRQRIQAFAGQYVTPLSRQLDESKQFNEFGLPGRLFANFLLTKTGYEALGFADTAIPADVAFRRGMRSPLTQEALGDPPTDRWEPGLSGQIDAMVLLADDDPEFLGRQARQMLTDHFDAIATVVSVEKGAAIRNHREETIEHFGYVDGRSQPVYFQEDLAVERRNGGIANWDPSAPIELVLAADPNSGRAEPLGTYVVFRKLEQNVREFKRAERESLASAIQLVGDDVERAGAMVVGRFEDGTPLAMQRGDGTDDPVLNNFNYADDAAGSRCPFHAHIRKTNPRTTTTASNDLPFDRAAERSRRITRRAITYGERSRASLDTDDLSLMPSGGVGLLFICCQSSLPDQFEFMQGSWANNANFPPGAPVPGQTPVGIDPVIGQAGGTPPAPPALAQLWPTAWGDDDFAAHPKAPFSFGGFVRMLGGEYFFAPSMPFLLQIVNPPAPPAPPVRPIPPGPGQPGYLGA